MAHRPFRLRSDVSANASADTNDLEPLADGSPTGEQAVQATYFAFTFTVRTALLELPYVATKRHLPVAFGLKL